MNHHLSRTVALLILAISSWAFAAETTIASGQRTTSFDADWRFFRGDASGAEKPEFADASWRTLDVPHDWMIEGKFDKDSPGGTEAAALDGGIGWYRKSFALPDDLGAKRVIIQFDGLYMNAEIWLNGQRVGNHPYGYTSFQFDVTKFVKPQTTNVLAVRTEVTQPCSRFYSGGGIYRHVWLSIVDPVHIAPWGTFVTSELTNGAATVTARTTIQNDSDQPANVIVQSVINDAADKAIADATAQPVQIEAGKSSDVTQTFSVANPTLWSIDSPNLYRLQSIAQVAGKTADTESTKFGIRTIEFTVDHGFLLNGQRVPIRGVCDHHDLGCLGSAVNGRAIQRQLEILKSFGCNAIRTSHNPPAPELLELCDEMGFVVMDEAFDEWKDGKRPLGYARFFDDWSERDLVSMIHRDRNHPSVVMWSIGNEIPEQRSKDGERMARRLTDICHREDASRAVTSALNNPNEVLETGFYKPLDLFGVNYNIAFYDNPHIRGKVPMIGSETSSDVSSRGEYGLSIKNGKVATTQRINHQVTSYDTYYPAWATSAEMDLKAIKNSPWVAGEFVWTGFDYLGEPTPFGWPARSSYFGIVDLCGFPKDRFYLYASQWLDKPVVHLLPHWNWEGFEGKSIPVWCYTNADSVELFLNGKSLGSRDWKSTKALHLEWLVPYAAGEVKAVATKDGKVIGTDTVFTAGKPAKIQLAVDRAKIKANVRDLSFITATVVDGDGRYCPNADNRITWKLDGPAKLVATDNGDATDLDSFQSKDRKVFHGMGLAVIEGARDAGKVHVTASADGIASAVIEIDTER